MPAAPRVLKEKATKIAFKILGVPQELKRNIKPKTNAQKKIAYDELSKVR